MKTFKNLQIENKRRKLEGYLSRSEKGFLKNGNKLFNICSVISSAGIYIGLAGMINHAQLYTENIETNLNHMGEAGLFTLMQFSLQFLTGHGRDAFNKYTNNKINDQINKYLESLQNDDFKKAKVYKQNLNDLNVKDFIDCSKEEDGMEISVKKF